MSNEIKNLAIIQARVGSSRLPNKVLRALCGKSVLEHVIDRVKKSALVDEVIVATTIGAQDLEIVKLCANHNIRVFCGSENDVLDRYYQVARLIKPENVIRITADCPLIDPEVIDLVIKSHLKYDNDYTSNVLNETFPDGQDVEIFKYAVLEQAWKESKLASQREHVTQYIIHSEKFSKYNVTADFNNANKRWTLDNEEDYVFIKEIYNRLYIKNKYFTMSDILKVVKEEPQLETINQNIKRNEGLQKSIENDFEV